MILAEDITPGAVSKRRGGAFVASLFAAVVRGPSMAPTLRDGDALLVLRGGRPVRAGDVVVATFRSRPDLLVVKRATHEQDGGWWLRGDNEFVTDDSRAYGVADVKGRVLLRYWPKPSRLRSRIMLDT
ncbi:S26 family signal peptidase [Asanoa sp. NPDC049518]|uniref:S26 family signal peptidase n=1 Tax=unclassified Asanoa TaxID=2685164 RepID=UPI00343E6E5A